MIRKLKNLYHYTSLDSFSKIWMSEHLLFADSKGTNDIFESKKISSLGNCKIPYNNEKTELEVMGHFMKKLWDEIGKYKQISLTQDYSDQMPGYSSPMMWGQYAQKGKGICIEINSNILDMPNCNYYHKPIRYTDNVPILEIEGVNLSTQEQIEYYVEEKLDDIFFTKHTHWKFENEYRIILKSNEYLNIKEAISNVYIPYTTESVEFKIIQKLLEGSNVDIRILTTSGVHTRKISSHSYKFFE